ncbi:MAG: hypothetical protein IJQ47_08465 [Synergistaceae bacterium]|nr:hypothetical protein [Synergistaceae bacterium]
MEEVEIFKTQREFNNKYPSHFYICSLCGKLIQNKYFCDYCGFRADGLLKTMGQGYKFIIEEQSPKIQEIFKPIERKNKNE